MCSWLVGGSEVFKFVQFSNIQLSFEFFYVSLRFVEEVYMCVKGVGFSLGCCFCLVVMNQLEQLCLCLYVMVN